MAQKSSGRKKKSIMIKLVNSKCPTFYVSKRKLGTGKLLLLRKYNPKTRKHEMFKEAKI
jgi:ribosomal protein L33